MKSAPFLVSLVLVVASSSGWTQDTAAERLLKDATVHLQKGEHELDRERRFVTPAGRLEVLGRAIRFLRQAQLETDKGTGEMFESVRVDVRRDLVRALDRQAAIFFERRSLTNAKDSTAAALELDPQDSWALNLSAMIQDAESTDIYEKYQGTAAVTRIRERRAASGLPLRDRGVSQRR